MLQQNTKDEIKAKFIQISFAAATFYLSLAKLK